MRHLNVGWKAYLSIGAALLVFAPATLAGQPLPERPGGSRPAQLAKPRIAPLPEAQWTDEHRQRIAKFLPAGARPGNSFRTLLNVPELVDRTMTFHNYITQDSSLSPRVRDLLILRTAWLHGSDVIWRERVPFARKAGLTNEEIRKIAQGPDRRLGSLRSEPAPHGGSAVPEFLRERRGLQPRWRRATTPAT